MIVTEDKPCVLKEGDRRPTVFFALKNPDGTPRNLTGFTNIKLIVAPVVGGRRLVDAASMSVRGAYAAATGWVQYTFAAGELKVGDYLMEIIVDAGLTYPETFPKGGYYRLTVVPHL
jgi:hypothetical protein